MADFGGIQRHVIREPRATLQGERSPSAILKIVFRRIYLFLFLMHFGLRRVAAFVSSSIHFLDLFFLCSLKLESVILLYNGRPA